MSEPASTFAASRSNLLRCCVVVAGISLAATNARAQSPNDDFDADAETFSDFWERALTPNLQLYNQLIARATAMELDHGERAVAEAERHLRSAISLSPERTEAYWMLGHLYTEAKDWPRCSQALAKLAQLDPRAEKTAGGPSALDIAYGLCLAREGKMEEALHRFRRVLARGDQNLRAYLLAGQALMATGALSKAIDLFEAARRIEGRNAVASRYALAVAFDREERAAKSQALLAALAQRDPRQSLLSTKIDFIPVEEELYYLGLVLADRLSERALVYFRKYLDEASNPAWRARARWHAERVNRSIQTKPRITFSGSAESDRDKTRSAIERHRPALVACTRDTPLTVFRVVMKRMAATNRGQHTSTGTSVNVVLTFSEETSLVENALACVDRVASEMTLPRVSGAPGSHLSVAFAVAWVDPAPAEASETSR